MDRWWLWRCDGSSCWLIRTIHRIEKWLIKRWMCNIYEKEIHWQGKQNNERGLVYLCGCFISLNCSVCSTKIVVTMNSVNHLNEVFRYFRNSTIARTGFEHKDLFVEINLEECSLSSDCLVVHHWYKNGLFAIIVLFYPITSPITLLYSLEYESIILFCFRLRMWMTSSQTSIL